MKRRKPHEPTLLERAVQIAARDGAMRPLLAQLIAPLFEAPASTPDALLFEAGRRAEALRWWGYLVALDRSAIPSLLAELESEQSDGRGTANGSRRGAEAFYDGHTGDGQAAGGDSDPGWEDSGF